MKILLSFITTTTALFSLSIIVKQCSAASSDDKQEKKIMQLRERLATRVPPSYATLPQFVERHARHLITTLDESEIYFDVKHQALIRGGTRVEPHDKYPFMVAALRNRDDKQQICGATLIAPNLILTAAHCSAHVSAAKIGMYDLYSSDEDNGGGDAQEFNIIRKFVHPAFNENTFNYDFAVLMMDGSADSKFTPIRVDDEVELTSSLNEDDRLFVAGWGKTDEFDGHLSDELLEVEVRHIPNAECDALYATREAGLKDISSPMMCAALPGQDSCQGDSGGPLIHLRGSEYVQVGIVSWGAGCANANYPGVYARVNQVSEWIKRLVSRYGDKSQSFATAEQNRQEASPKTFCLDVPHWEDSRGKGCEWYHENHGLCGENSDVKYRSRSGFVAKEACCHCGGGMNDTNYKEFVKKLGVRLEWAEHMRVNPALSAEAATQKRSGAKNLND